ncbi:uncharacterized protein [Triticum aestivum]|uniref:uncharacterized protein n=1 Tax=Triticum aestivum TaxID=4565 RepID=UPI001D011C29|nr:uncharacterized protein LOC123067494 [Triticum aestivum]
MNSLPTATSPRPADDTEVQSQRVPEQGEAALETPQGEIPDAGHMGSKIPMDYADESRSKLGSQPDTAPEPPKVPDSGAQPLAREGEPAVPMTSVAPEASDSLLEVLRGASMGEEHHTLMSAVIQKVRSAKRGLTEARTSLLTGFEAVLLAAAAWTTEVAGLERDLKQAEEELGLTKRQLEENKGAATEVAAVKKALSEAEGKAAMEALSVKSKMLGWARYNKSSRSLARSSSPWSVTSRRKSPSLRRPFRAQKMPGPKPKRANATAGSGGAEEAFRRGPTTARGDAGPASSTSGGGEEMRRRSTKRRSRWRGDGRGRDGGDG